MELRPAGEYRRLGVDAGNSAAFLIEKGTESLFAVCVPVGGCAPAASPDPPAA